MLGLNLSAFGIYHLSGGFNVFHFLAVISLLTVVGGYYQAAVRPSPRWLWRHYQYMSWSYVGLLAATSNEAFVRVPALRSLARHTTPHLPLGVMLAILAASGGLIFSRQGRVMREYGS